MILDKDGKPLSPEEEDDFTDDLFSQIPMGRGHLAYMWDKWGDRLGTPKPEWLDEYRAEQEKIRASIKPIPAPELTDQAIKLLLEDFLSILHDRLQSEEKDVSVSDLFPTYFVDLIIEAHKRDLKIVIR